MDLTAHTGDSNSTAPCPEASLCEGVCSPQGTHRPATHSLPADTRCYLITGSRGVANELWACSVVKKDILAAARAAWAGGEGDTAGNQNAGCNTDRPASL